MKAAGLTREEIGEVGWSEKYWDDVKAELERATGGSGRRGDQSFALEPEPSLGPQPRWLESLDLGDISPAEGAGADVTGADVTGPEEVGDGIAGLEETSCPSLH